MKNKKNVAILIDVYSAKGGASQCAIYYARSIRDVGYNTVIACNRAFRGDVCPKDVYEIRSINKCYDFLAQNDIDVVHYFKAAKSHLDVSVFRTFICASNKIEKDIRFFISVCQQPSCPSVILTPFEITHSDYIFFIDKTAYNDPLFKFLPVDRKLWAYLTNSKHTVADKEQDKFAKVKYTTADDDTIIFGRGSTLNKCPKDLIEVYEKIDTKQKKKFVIVGVPETPNWLSHKIGKRGEDDVVTYPILPSIQYAEILNSLDVFLYYIPRNIYSSIDGSLRTAMRIGLPVVVYGAPAPKETIIHGVNGFIADTKEDFIKYAEQLAADAKLRETIGQNARKLYFENAPEQHWHTVYVQTMEQVCNSEKQPAISVPLLISLKIYFLKYSAWCSEMLLKIWSLLLKR